MKYAIAVAVAGVAVVAGGAHADSITLQPGAEGKDTLLSSQYVDQNYGSFTLLTGNLPGVYHAGLLEFDLSAIATDAILTSATLTLYHQHNGGAGDVWNIYRNTAAWTEGDATWSTAPSFDATPAASLTITDSNAGVYRSWDVTSLVQGWISGDYANFGMRLADPVLSNTVMFASSDTSTAAFRPALAIEFAANPVPLPAAAWGGMALMGLIGAKRLRRKRADA